MSKKTDLEILREAKEKPFVSVKELALILGVHHATVRDYMKKNLLPYTRIGKTYAFDREKVIDLVASGVLDTSDENNDVKIGDTIEAELKVEHRDNPQDTGKKEVEASYSVKDETKKKRFKPNVDTPVL